MFQQMIVIGRLGNNPEIRSTPTGRSVVSFSLASTRTWTAGGERHERTVWFRVAAWDKLADVCARYLRKGAKVQVVGELEEPRVYTDNEGNSRASLEMTARNVTFLSGREEEGAFGTAAPAPAWPVRAPLTDDVPF